MQKISTPAIKSIQLNVHVAGFILLCVASMFFVLTSATADADEIASGGWVEKKYSMDGGWSVHTENGQTIIRLNDQFSTKNGPDLKVFLSRQSIDTVTGKTATDDAVLVSVLQSNKGAQEYVLPENVNISDFQSLLIHCEKYSVLWGGTAL